MLRTQMAAAAKPRRRVRYRYLIPLLILLWVAAVILYNTHKPLPSGVSFEGPVRHVQDIDFLYDLTFKQDSRQIHEQSIYDHVFRAIESADQFIVLDMFLFNGYYDKGKSYPPLSSTLADKLIAQKAKHPNLQVVFISDDVNTDYGSHPSPELDRLKAHGIDTLITDVNPLRDSTPLYSGVWRTFIQWFGQSGEGWLPNAMANTAPKITARSYLKLLNVKANHRKVIATEKTAIITSGNPHDASGYHSNIAFELHGDLIGDLLATEQAVSDFSNGPRLPVYQSRGEQTGDIDVRLLTEGKIYQHVLQSIDSAKSGETIWMGMFYLADGKVIDSLLAASERGVNVRLILDPNENAFGQKKVGIPNRPVAAELMQKSGGRIQIRWYNTGEEQYHTKLMLVQGKDTCVINGGSANFTPRNLDDLNLETNIEIQASPDAEVIRETEAYFKRLWENEGGNYTLDYPAFEDRTTPVKKLIYKLQTILGFTTF